MPRRTFDRSTSSESNVIDMNTRKPAAKNMMPVICERIRFYRKQMGMEQKTLARMVGVTANAVCNWESGCYRPDVNLLPDICEALQITLYQLYDLKDPSIRYTAAEEMFMDDYRQLTPGNRYAVSSLTRTLLKVQQVERNREIRRLTLFEHQLAAGVGDPNEFEDSGVPIYVYDDSLTRRADCVFIVNGDSMEPDYPNGCMVLVKRISDSGDLAPGDIGAFMIDNETYIKEYQPDGLHSHNPKYKTIHPGPDDNFRCVGRVLGVVTQDMYPTAQELDVLNEVYSQKHKR